MRQKIKPKSKTEAVVTQEVAGELLVYDLEENRAHSLNDSAAKIWTLCDGSREIESIEKEFSNEYRDTRVCHQVVNSALRDLAEAGLVSGFDETEAEGISRRKLIRKVGLTAAVGLPVVASLAMPSSALAAGSAASPGSPCSSPIDCQSGACFGSPPTCL